eukprot:3384417-Alexandrium_andersonii.AAC.1
MQYTLVTSTPTHVLHPFWVKHNAKHDPKSRWSARSQHSHNEQLRCMAPVSLPCMRKGPWETERGVHESVLASAWVADHSK